MTTLTDRCKAIEDDIAANRLTAAQVFTQMRQLLSSRPGVPVAWMHTSGTQVMVAEGKRQILEGSHGDKIKEAAAEFSIPLYTVPPSRDEVLEEAAIACDGVAQDFRDQPPEDNFTADIAAAEECAAAIRALKVKP